MKKLWITTLLSAMIICFSETVNAKNAKEMAGMQELPQTVQTFLQNHFPGIAIYKTYLKNWGEYKVKLANGYQIEFDKDGNWEDIENDQHEALPASIVALLPQAACDYIAKEYPNARVYEIEKEKRGYEVKLHGDRKIKLYFDTNGNLLRQKNDN